MCSVCGKQFGDFSNMCVVNALVMHKHMVTHTQVQELHSTGSQLYVDTVYGKGFSIPVLYGLK